MSFQERSEEESGIQINLIFALDDKVKIKTIREGRDK